MRRLVAPLALLLLYAGAVRAQDGPVEVGTEHYRLEYEGTEAQGRAYGRVLEAAWKGMATYFGKTPDVEEGEPLRIRFFATHDAWANAMRHDGLTPPTDAGGYYASGRKTAYLYRQPTEYFTRVLLVHEATHQFHYLACTRNRQPTSAWYREGVAEFLSWHTWDGEAMTLGVRPLVTLKDHARTALEAVTAKDFDLEALVEGRTWAGYDVSWALFRYLATGRGGKPLKHFDTFCRKMDAGGAVGPLFKRFFKGTKRFRVGFAAWLEAEQQPWTQVFNEWEDQGGGAIRGHAPVVSFCRTKANVTHLEAGLEVPKRGGPWRGGLLLHYADNRDYVVALIDGTGNLRVDRRKDGAWTRLASHPVTGEPDHGVWHLVARRKGGKVHLEAGGQGLGSYTLPVSSMGLAVDASDLRFRDVVWD